MTHPMSLKSVLIPLYVTIAGILCLSFVHQVETKGGGSFGGRPGGSAVGVEIPAEVGVIIGIVAIVISLLGCGIAAAYYMFKAEAT